MHARIVGCISFILIVGEVVLCFVGPMALISKPTLMLCPLYQIGLDQTTIEELTAFAERSLAATKAFSVKSQAMVADYLLKVGKSMPEGDLVFIDRYLEMARELDLDRLAAATVMRTDSQLTLSVTIRAVKTGDPLKSERFSARDLEGLLAGRDEGDQELQVVEKLRMETRGVSLYDWLFFALLAFQLVLSVRAMLGTVPTVLAEVLIVPFLLLFLFAYVFALNANMPYVQRFIANSGQLALAESTAQEQAYAAIRFLPLLLLNVWFYLQTRLKVTGPHQSDALKRIIMRWALPWAIISAVGYALSLPSFISLRGVPALAWFCVVPLFTVLAISKPAWGFFYGVTFGAVQALIINYWHGTYDYLALHFMVIVQVVWWALFMLGLVWALKLSGRLGFLVIPAGWIALEYARSLGYIGYPWGIAGVSQYAWLPAIQIAALGGVWAVSFVVILVNAALAWSLVAYARHKRIRVPQTYVPVLVACVTVAACLAYGFASMGVELRAAEERERVSVVLVQQNTDPRKHDYSESFANLVDLTDQALAELPRKPDLVVWSEGAFKPDIRRWSAVQHKQYGYARLVQEFLEYQRSLGGWLVTGNQDHRYQTTPSGEQLRQDFNATVLFDASGKRRETYHKMHMVPFTEHFPYKEQLPELYALLDKFDISDWTVGDARIVYRHPRIRFITPICFEDVFPNDLRMFVRRGVDMIINVSNDYWSLTPVEGKQHAVHALFRAVENRRPLLRATSSGYTAHIDTVGRIHPGSPQPYTAAYQLAEVRLPAERWTLYTRYGDWLPLVFGAGILVLLVCQGLILVVRRRSAT